MEQFKLPLHPEDLAKEKYVSHVDWFDAGDLDSCGDAISTLQSRLVGDRRTPGDARKLVAHENFDALYRLLASFDALRAPQQTALGDLLCAVARSLPAAIEAAVAPEGVTPSHPEIVALREALKMSVFLLTWYAKLAEMEAKMNAGIPQSTRGRGGKKKKKKKKKSRRKSVDSDSEDEDDDIRAFAWGAQHTENVLSAIGDTLDAEIQRLWRGSMPDEVKHRRRRQP